MDARREMMMANYERILRIVIIIDGLLGLILLLWPCLIAAAPGGDDDWAGTWVRGAGLFLLLLSLALLPAATFAMANRYLALFAALAQVSLGLFFAFSGARLAWLLAIYGFVSAYLLLAAFWRGFQQYLMSKP
jgi:hypothetical protein